MLKLAVIIKGEQEAFLLECSKEGKTYSNVLRMALTEYMQKRGLETTNASKVGKKKKHQKEQEGA